MSSTANLFLEENTGSLTQSDNPTYLLGSEKTDPLSADEPPKTDPFSAKEGSQLLKPRTPIPLKVVRTVNQQKEDIKQIWSGVVTEINDQELTVKLEDITNPDNPDEIVVLSLEEIEKREWSLIEVGAMFLWHIGYRSGPKYPMQRFSKISFRRLPKWTSEEIHNAEILAKEYANFFLTDKSQAT